MTPRNPATRITRSHAPCPVCGGHRWRSYLCFDAAHVLHRVRGCYLWIDCEGLASISSGHTE
jgi:hypothetical protein